MARSRSMFALLVVAFGSIALAKTALLTDIPLLWKPTSDLKLGGVVQGSGASIKFEPFVDQRDKPDIGQTQEDSTPKPVTTKDDVGAFVGTHMRELFNKAGY